MRTDIYMHTVLNGTSFDLVACHHVDYAYKLLKNAVKVSLCGAKQQPHSLKVVLDL